MRQPMLAVNVEDSDLALLRFPMYASIKLDGIRAVVRDEQVLSRSMKPIRNRHVQSVLGTLLNEGFDGELLYGDGKSFQTTSSEIMSEFGGDDFTYHVFDAWNWPQTKYLERYECLKAIVAAIRHPRVHLLEQRLINNLDEMLNYEEEVLSQGHEGIILRGVGSLYKYGRSTLREQYLLKRKPFLDDEATITGFEEQMENVNEQIFDERGYARRSTSAEGKIPKGTLGKIKAHHPLWGEIVIGSGQGLTHALRQEIWDNREVYLGRCVKFKYLPVGIKDKPRLPIFLGFRDEEDL